MKLQRILKRLLVLAAGLSATFACASAAFAQGCALCYSDAAATGPRAQAALRHGILILMIPPTLIFVAMLSILYRRRNVHRESLEDIEVLEPHTVNGASEIVLHLK